MNEVSLNIQKVINELLPQAIKEGLEAVGQFVENESKKNSPVDDGTLRASISHDVEDNTVYIGSNVEYAAYVHQGTFKMEGRPFLSDAVDQNMDKLVKPFENLLDKQRRG